MKRTIIFIIIIYAVLVGITIINVFTRNISGLFLCGFSLIALLLFNLELMPLQGNEEYFITMNNTDENHD